MYEISTGNIKGESGNQGENCLERDRDMTRLNFCPSPSIILLTEVTETTIHEDLLTNHHLIMDAVIQQLRATLTPIDRVNVVEAIEESISVRRQEAGLDGWCSLSAKCPRVCSSCYVCDTLCTCWQALFIDDDPCPDDKPTTSYQSCTGI